MSAKQPDPKALTAYRYAVVGIVPLVGLLLGPAAVVLGAWSWWQGRVDGRNKGSGFAAAAVVLGALEVLTNGLGLALMWVGWNSL